MIACCRSSPGRSGRFSLGTAAPARLDKMDGSSVRGARWTMLWAGDATPAERRAKRLALYRVGPSAKGRSSERGAFADRDACDCFGDRAPRPPAREPPTASAVTARAPRGGLGGGVRRPSAASQTLWPGLTTPGHACSAPWASFLHPGQGDRPARTARNGQDQSRPGPAMPPASFMQTYVSRAPRCI